MFLIIKNLDSSVGIGDIEKLIFVGPKGFFSNKGKIKAIKIIGLETNSGKLIERHGLVRVEPESYKKALVKTLISQRLNGAKVIAADYAIRHWSNDPRENNQKTLFSFRKKISRVNERRRTGLHVISIAEKAYT